MVRLIAEQLADMHPAHFYIVFGGDDDLGMCLDLIVGRSEVDTPLRERRFIFCRFLKRRLMGI
jgi:hypothetical protein